MSPPAGSPGERGTSEVQGGLPVYAGAGDSGDDVAIAIGGALSVPGTGGRRGFPNELADGWRQVPTDIRRRRRGNGYSRCPPGPRHEPGRRPLGVEPLLGDPGDGVQTPNSVSAMVQEPPAGPEFGSSSLESLRIAAGAQEGIRRAQGGPDGGEGAARAPSLVGALGDKLGREPRGASPRRPYGGDGRPEDAPVPVPRSRSAAGDSPGSPGRD